MQRAQKAFHSAGSSEPVCFAAQSSVPRSFGWNREGGDCGGSSYCGLKGSC